MDVRPPEEFLAGHLPGAVNIPIDALRDKISVLEKSILVVVYCYFGYRGYLAYRILVQQGCNAVNLDGGLQAFLNGVYKLLKKPQSGVSVLWSNRFLVGPLLSCWNHAFGEVQSLSLMTNASG